jgi:hypothetical protein
MLATYRHHYACVTFAMWLQDSAQDGGRPSYSHSLVTRARMLWLQDGRRSMLFVMVGMHSWVGGGDCGDCGDCGCNSDVSSCANNANQDLRAEGMANPRIRADYQDIDTGSGTNRYWTCSGISDISSWTCSTHNWNRENLTLRYYYVLDSYLRFRCDCRLRIRVFWQCFFLLSFRARV